MDQSRAAGERLTMGKKDRDTPESAAASFGVGHLTRHLFLCAGPDCVDSDDGMEAWQYLKGRMKELGLSGPDGPAYRTRCNCLRICTGGPIGVVYPEGTWYRNLTPANIERVLQQHIIKGRVVEDLCFAKNALGG